MLIGSRRELVIEFRSVYNVVDVSICDAILIYSNILLIGG